MADQNKTRGAIERAIEAAQNTNARLSDLVGTGERPVDSDGDLRARPAPKGRRESVGTASMVSSVSDEDYQTAEEIARRFRKARARKAKRGQYMKTADQMRRALRKRLIKRCPSFGHKHVRAVVDDVLPV